MNLYADDPPLQELHRHWLAAQARMLEAHDAARTFETRLCSDYPMSPEELVSGADLAERARDATEIWQSIDARFKPLRMAYLESQSRHLPVAR